MPPYPKSKKWIANQTTRTATESGFYSRYASDHGSSVMHHNANIAQILNTVTTIAAIIPTVSLHVRFMLLYLPLLVSHYLQL